MTVTYTNLRFNILCTPSNSEVMSILSDLERFGKLSIEVNTHVTGPNSNIVLEKIQKLHSLGVIENYEYNSLVQQVESLKRLYLK